MSDTTPQGWNREDMSPEHAAMHIQAMLSMHPTLTLDVVLPGTPCGGCRIEDSEGTPLEFYAGSLRDVVRQVAAHLEAM